MVRPAWGTPPTLELLPAAAQPRRAEPEPGIIAAAGGGNARRHHAVGQGVEGRAHQRQLDAVEEPATARATGWEGANLTVKLESVEAKTTSGHDGDFSVRLAPRRRRARGRPRFGRSARPGIATAVAQVEILDPLAPFFVVSTSTTPQRHRGGEEGEAARVGALEGRVDQPAVPGMAALYRCIRTSPPTRRRSRW